MQHHRRLTCRRWRGQGAVYGSSADVGGGGESWDGILKICMREIKRCQQESSGISYVLILGNKYGFRPFPAKIPDKEFKLLKEEMAKQAKQTASTPTSAALNKAMEYMDEWFVLNENVVPPTRELKPVKKEHSDAWWSDIFPTLQMCLRQAATGAPGLSNERRALYVQSVTAEEIDNGLFKVQPKEARDKACFVFDRRLEGIDVASDPDTAKLFIDMAGGEVDEEAQQQLERSRAEAVPAALSPSRIKTMTIPWGPGIDLARTDHAEYMRTFADAFCDTLAANIERVAREHAFESDAVVEEAAAHAMFGNLRRCGFVSTTATQQTADAALAYVQQRITIGKEVAAPFAICGPSGSGKTSLMAHIAGTMKEAHPNAVVVSRFLGTSRESGTARTLMANVYRHIHRAVKGKEPAASPAADFEKLTEQFQAALKLGTARKPLVLVLDSLDQLSDEDQGRNLEWLPLASLPPNCAIVVSTLPDVGGCWEVLKATLPDTNQQHRSVVLGVYESCPTPLYLRICTQFFALRWNHTDAIAPDFFPKTVEGLMEKVFDELETRHGKETVRAALGYLSASRGGLSDNEMEDLLSCNDTVLDEIYEWWVPPVRRVPPLIWARIVSDLEGALVERGAEGGVTVRAWYHRQHREAAERRYLGLNSRSGAGNDTGDDSDGNGDGAGDGSTATSSSTTTTTAASTSTTTTALTVQRHGELADYFSGKWEHGRHLHDKTDDASALRDRKVASMKTVLAGRLDDPRSGVVVNARKVAVLPFHLMHAQRWEECATTLCDLEFIEAKATAGMVRQLVADFEDLLRSGGGSSGGHGGALESLLKKHSFDIWARFVARNALIFERTPGAVVARASLYPDETAVFKAAETLLSTPGCRLPRVRQYNKPQELDPLVCVCSARWFSDVRDVIFTRDSRWVCGCGSPSGAGDVHVWEARTGTPVARLRKPNDNAKAARIVQLPSGLIAVACTDGKVYVRKLATHEVTRCVEVFDPESEELCVLRMTDDDALVWMMTGDKPPKPKHPLQLRRDGDDDDDDVPGVTRIMLFSVDFSHCVWKCTMQDKLCCGQIRNNTLVAGTKSGSVIWFELKGLPTPSQRPAQSSMAGDQAALVQVARYNMERRSPAVTTLCLLHGGLDVVVYWGSHLYKLKADGTMVARVLCAMVGSARTLAASGSLVVVGGFGDSTKVYDVTTMTSLRSVGPAPTGIVTLSPDDTLLAVGGSDTLVSVFDWEEIKLSNNAGAKQTRSTASLATPTIALMAAPPHRQQQQRQPQNVVVFIGSGGSGAKHALALYEAANMTAVKAIDIHNSGDFWSFNQMSGSPDGRIVLCYSGTDKAITAVNTVTSDVHKNVITSRKTHRDWQVFFAPTSDSCVLIDGCDVFLLALPACKQVVVRDPEYVHTELGVTDEVTCCVWHPQYPHVRQFATGSKNHTARLWQLNTDDEGNIVEVADVRVFAGHKGPVYSLAMCTDDQGGVLLATFAAKNGIQLWNLNDGASPIRSLSDPFSSDYSLLWLPRQRLLATYTRGGRNLECRNLSGEVVRAIKLGPHWMILHPSEKYLVVPSYGGFQLLDANTLEVAFQSFGHDGEVSYGNLRAVRMAPDGLHFVSQSADNIILVHDLSLLPL
ncbi:hypothetical protein PTSG_02861 [Salpingoeca rosetta]|uniref:Uncharacterized protein n=1 Tax=Salpingoeca rosetta (strain ATCC 50818 / BSB-021) TaxID=946362 RepID=F2U3J5_SALR5|nr:uncharacterized protein PTSG_02861 [Salpingoeca rosetta]EGD82189.1 hypothetical protein PTSG_02861 [Salpingoeca rosetta]|eukprot:XP_004996372.1 hypothetical protein PTSG_02861 [Salpingoeca rosetta]